eukprot:GHVS01077597.1.p2 GENE.GHVS01077597.1~~GHVS01077597.1.p2  ORF type:complete len:105 (+),score=10.49 GHVS01077597.1:215-529(+)
MKGIFINPEEDSGTPPPAVSARKLTATSKKNFSNNNARSGALADRNVIKLVVIKMAASQRKARHMIRQLCTTSAIKTTFVQVFFTTGTTSVNNNCWFLAKRETT